MRLLTSLSNVDRLWDIWQALNPDSYVIDKVATRQEANFFIAANTRINATTDLKPFYDASATKFWTSAGVKYTTPFGYAYPETQRWLFSSNTAYQADVRAKVTNEYGANVINNFFTNIAPEIAKDTVPIQTASLKQGALSKSVVKEATQHPIVAAQQILAQLPQQVNSPKPVVEAKPKNPRSDSAQTAVASASATPVDAQTPPPSSPTPATTVPLYVPSQFAHLVKDRTYTEWITNLRTIKHALSQTFRVYIFLGDFNPDPTTWPTEYNVVGRFTVLGRDTSTACSKCKVDRENELVVTGTVPLTSALLQDIVDGQLASLEPSDVQLYLEKHLHWRVTVFDGSEVAREDVPGLKVGVVSTEVKIAADGLPVYSGVYAQYPGITDGRPAGLRAGDAV
jgi:tyrosinase